MRKLTRIGLLIAVFFVLGGCYCGFSTFSYGYRWSPRFDCGPSVNFGFRGCH
ncbi:MAG: hypothetical protein L0Y44_04290 [Phycisphaerales bacterium]|nr:hypothetical protein [Phycisphaerales bacterium]MCI0629858.1 hypothetical protein [Phycisphaerales bacterium]MCI0674869.1 hypothetical protein [Phycisphaerales bacterium]